MQTYNQLRIDSSNKKFFPCSWSNKSSPIGMNFEIENTFSLFFFSKTLSIHEENGQNAHERTG